MQITYTCLECGKPITDGGRIYCEKCQTERENAHVLREKRTVERIVKDGFAYDEAQIYCPCCGEVYEVDPETESHVLESGESVMKCYCCGERFRVDTYVFRSYTTQKID